MTHRMVHEQAEQRHLEAQTLLTSARAQLEGGNKELAGLQQQLQQGLAAVYQQARSLFLVNPCMSCYMPVSRECARQQGPSAAVL